MAISTIPAAAIGYAGAVLQVVNATYGTETNTNTTTWTDTGLTATITPTKSTSKILVLVDQTGCGKDNSNTRLGLRLLRNGSSIIQMDESSAYNAGSGGNFIGAISTCYLDSPATTSATTYKTQQNSYSNSSGTRTQQGGSGSNVVSTITLLEIAQ